MYIFEVFLVRILDQIREKMVQKNSKYGQTLAVQHLSNQEFSPTEYKYISIVIL